jgi:NDP-sugar pyrophosphorylase family protein
MTHNTKHIIVELSERAKQTQVAVMAGGEGKRMGYINVPKPLIEVNSETLLSRCIRYMASNGFEEFIVLTKFQEVVKEAERLKAEGYNIRCSMDPPLKKVGKGKALKHALETGAIDPARRVFVVFPDDLFLDESLPLRFLSSHIEAVNRLGVYGSVAVTAGLQLPYGYVEVDSLSLATSFKEKPVLPIHASTGLYILEPQALKILQEVVDMNSEEAVEFESVLLPGLAEKGKLHAFIVPRDAWLPVNTLKELEEATKTLKGQSQKQL